MAPVQQKRAIGQNLGAEKSTNVHTLYSVHISQNILLFVSSTRSHRYVLNQFD